MGIAADLGYAYPRTNVLQRLVRWFASTRVGARTTPHTLVPLDRLTSRLSRGRISLPVVLAGLPVLELTTTGRKSGMPRRTHVIAIPFEETLALLGTNFGQPATPAWALNLEADPRATVAYHGITRAVVARPADDAQRRAIHANAEEAFAGTATYEQMVHGRREIRTFVLSDREEP